MSTNRIDMVEDHIIKTQVYDVSYSDQSKAPALQTRLSQLNSSQVQSELNKILDYWEEKLGNIQLNQVAVDLGAIQEDKLDQQLPEKLKEALNKYFENLLLHSNSTSNSKNPERLNGTDRSVMLLEYLLVYGTMPWWAKRRGAVKIEELINELIAKNKTALTSLIRKYKSHRSVITRLVSHTTDQVIFKLIRALNPSEAKVVIEIGQDTIKVHEKRKVINASQRQFRNKVWEFVLLYLLSERGSFFNTKDFVSSLLLGVAQYFNISYAEILQHMHPAILNLQKELYLRHNLAGIIEELYQEEVARNEPKKDKESEELNESVYSESYIEEQLRLGKSIESISDKELESIIKTILSKRNKTLLKKLLKKSTEPEFESKLLSLSLPKAVRQHLGNAISKSELIKERSKLEWEALKSYLTSGSIKSEASGLKVDQLRKKFSSLIFKLSTPLKTLIKNEGKRQSVRTRILQLLEEPEIKGLITLIEPDNDQKIFQFADQLQTSKKQAKLKVNIDNKSFVKLKWAFILEALLVDRGSRFNLKTFIRNTIFNMAAHLNLSKQSFFEEIIIQLNQIKSTGSSAEIILALQELQKEEIQVIKKRKAEAKTRNQTRVRFEWISFVIQRNANPWWAKEHDLKLQDFGSILLQLTQSHLQKLKPLLKASLRHTQKRAFVLSLIGQREKLYLIKILYEKDYEAIIDFASSFDKTASAQQAESTRLEEHKWDAIFSYLSSIGRAKFNLKDFALAMLQELVSHFNYSYVSFLEIYLVLNRQHPSEALRKVIQEIEADTTKAGLIKPDLKKPISTAHLIAWIEQYLHRGFLEKWQIKILSEKSKALFESPEYQVQSFLNKLKGDPTSIRSFKNLLEALSIHEVKGFESLKELSEDKKKESKPAKASIEHQLTSLLNEIKSSNYWAISHKSRLTEFLSSNSKSLNTKHLKESLGQTEYSKPEFSRAFGQIGQSNQEAMINLLINNESRFLKDYNRDLVLLFDKLSHVNASNIQKLLSYFSLEYLVFESKYNKHDYFKKAVLFIIKKLNIPYSEAQAHFQETFENQKDQFRSTIPLSWNKSQKSQQKEAPLDTTAEEAIKEDPIINEQEESLELEDQVSISNAGLVILWPYLEQYFKMLHLSEGSEFNDQNASSRAALLLQYLATGQTEFEEYELFLNKVICGLNPLDPIDVTIQLSDHEKEISESLLNGVIQNWPKMQDTSIAALRETFIMRDGLIQILDEQIELRVEKKTLDILLETIPWSYSIVKLPWMEKAMHVLW